MTLIFSGSGVELCKQVLPVPASDQLSRLQLAAGAPWLSRGSQMADEAQVGASAAPAEAPKRQKGVTKWFNATKGYGFVTPLVEGDEQPEEIFVHQVCSE